jgi:hypothetical protein
VQIQTDLTTHLDREATAGWLQGIDRTAAQVRRDGGRRSIAGPAGTVRISSEPLDGTTFLGVPIQADGWRRLARAVRGKERQTSGVPSVWIRIDALDGFFQFTGWRQLPWPKRVDVLSAAVRDGFGDTSHVAGLIISSGLATSLGADPASEDATVVTPAGAAVCRVVYPHVMRETFIVPLQTDVADELEVWTAG